MQGTWNLHNALQVHVDKDLKNEPHFLLLTSSVSGTVGTATESNYCSANGFLDAFAQWRRSRGQACVAVGLGMISEVGYQHENPEIESLLLLKGVLAEKESQDVASQHGHAVVVSAATWFTSIPSTLSPAFAPVADSDTLRIAIMQLIKTRFSNLILVAIDQISEDKPLPSFGVDIMIASEFRSWLWTVLRIDIPFLDIMSTKTSLAVLAELVKGKL
ncbi:KR domain-containing protein [Fusarium oxysporum]|uniref:Ketoreductase (KR) domain-containing protein n=2 Tax=Fusarium oxysporum TaxID=5507 RepID=A0A420MQ17_FUSOX|nr:KR domain-containing protein [Fusarium oxysporum]RKK70093.1 hypothetical protein BFJ69_g12113 [Fusarium oxysporum]